LLSQGWQLKLFGSVAIVGTLFTVVGESVLAQIVPDNTLGAEGSVVTPDVNIQGVPSDQIDGGATRGANLFHSFSDFNVREGRGAYFANPTGIENILTRVTGGNPFNILGRLGVLGGANLFLLNPNGIVFGPSASLDVQGSFVATTANAIQFSNGEVFSASTPSAPSSLLTVNPSAFFFNQVPAGAIANYSRTPVGATPLGNQFGLRVPDGRSLLLVGGDIVMDGGGAIARDGQIELGAIAGSGTVGLNVDGNDLSLSFPDGADRADISLGNGALVSVNGEGGGDIQVEGRRITLSGGSQISTTTLGAETGRTLAVTASDSVELIGESADGQFSSGLFAQSVGSGDAGNLTIDTPRLLVSDGAVVSAATFAEGKGGRLQITASDSVELIGESADGRRLSGLFAQSVGSGDAGNLTIDTPRLLVRDGAQVSATTLAEGNGGRLLITASDSVEVIGRAANGQFSSGLFAESRGSGDAGDLTIDTPRLLVSDRARISAGTLGEGNGGRLLITASHLLVQNGATVLAITFAEGNSGSLQITVSESVELIGITGGSRVATGLFTSSQGSGDAGDLTIDTRRLLVRDGAQVAAGTLGEGNGSRLQITASDSIEVIGGSGLFTQSQGTGNAGDLTIATPRLLVRDRAQVSAATRGSGKGGKLTLETAQLSLSQGGQIVVSTSGTGDAGQLNVNATQIELIGTDPIDGAPSGLFANVNSNATGIGGDVTIDVGRLLLRDGAVISSRSRGNGTAGNIDITVRDTLEADNGTIQTNTSRSAGGAITINAGAIRLFGDSDIISNVASGADNGGNINLTADSILAFDDSDILAFARDGRGGDINLDTPAFFGENYRPAPRNTDPRTLERNNQVDVNADAAAAVNSGTITRPDTTFIQNSLTELPENQIDIDSLLANSCIVRRNQPTQGTFTITGTGGLPQRPGDAQMSTFPTVDIETLPSDDTSSTTTPNRPWHKGDPIVEPQGVYRLPNGKLVMSRECP
jgi:filamentous hemagglutinin family protein